MSCSKLGVGAAAAVASAASVSDVDTNSESGSELSAAEAGSEQELGGATESEKECGADGKPEKLPVVEPLFGELPLRFDQGRQLRRIVCQALSANEFGWGCE